MNNKQLNKIMREQFAPPAAEPIELPQIVESRIEKLSSRRHEKPYKRSPVKAIVALSVSFVMLLGIVLPVALSIANGGGNGGGWRDPLIQNISNAQFTPDYDRIVYNPNNAVTAATVTTGISTEINGSVVPLNAAMVNKSSETLMRIDAEDIIPDTIGYGLTNKDWIQNQTKANKEFAQYCVQNLSEAGVWQKLDNGRIFGFVPSGLIQNETYAMFAVSDDGIIDIYAQTDGVLNDRWYSASEGEYAYIKKHITVDPLNDTVETWAEESAVFSNEDMYYSSHCPYIYVKKDSSFLISYETDYSRYPYPEYINKIITVEEYSRTNDNYFGVSTNLIFIDDEETGGIKPFGSIVTLMVASGANYTLYVLEDDQRGAVERQSVYCGAADWSFNSNKMIRNRKNGEEHIRQEDMWVMMDVTALSGIKAYHVDFSDNDLINNYKPVEKIELNDGTLIDETALPMLANHSFSAYTPEYMYFSGKTRGKLSINRTYYNESPLYSDILKNAIHFPAGIGYKDDLDFTTVDNLENLIKNASIWGIEKAYENPDKFVEKLNGFVQKELAFIIEK